MTSIDEGMQIDESNEQSRNANIGSCRIRHPLSNVTLETICGWQKKPKLNDSTQEGINTSGSFPKSRTRHVPSKSSKKLPWIVNCSFPGATDTLTSLVLPRDKETRTESPAGRQIDESETQP
jgi:hypothetical protein